MCVFLIYSAVFVYLHHAQTLLLALLGQVHPEILAHPVVSRKISIVHLHCTPLAPVTAYIQLQWVTHALSQRSFISWFTLWTTVSSAAARSTIALLSSLTLYNSGGKSQASVSLRLANATRQSACVHYRWSSWPRIAEARSSRVSLNKDKRNSQDKLQL